MTPSLGLSKRRGARGTEPACQGRRLKRCEFDPWVGKILWTRKWQPTPVILPGKFHGQRSLAGYSPWAHKQSDMTERAHTHKHTLLLLFYVSIPNTKDKAMLFLTDTNNLLLTNSSFFHDLITTKVENCVYSGSSGSILSNY